MSAMPSAVARAHTSAQATAERVLGEHALTEDGSCTCDVTSPTGQVWSQAAFTTHVATHMAAALVPAVVAAALEAAAQDLSTGDDFALRSGTNDLDGYDHGVLGAAKKLRTMAAQTAASNAEASTLPA